MHENLFSYGDQQEVYSALQRDYKRDSKQIRIMDAIGLIALIYLARHLPTWDYVAVIALAMTVVSRLNTFIDNSNRNFAMHLIDWIEARKNDAP